MSVSTRQFDLYDFFSVLLPGVLLLSGIYLYLPKERSIDLLSLVLPVLAGGYIAGRFLHVVAVELETRFLSVVSHREKLQKELLALNAVDKTPELFDEDTLQKFCEECENTLELNYDLPPAKGDIRESIKEQADEIDEDELSEKVELEVENRVKAVYTRVRGHVHFDSRGRSRTFQALFAFYRSTWLAFLLLGLLYFSYPAGQWLSHEFNFELVLLPYQPKISEIQNLDLEIALAEIIGLLSMSFFTFGQAKNKYRDYYLEYLVSDYLLIQRMNRQKNRISHSVNGISLTEEQK